MTHTANDLPPPKRLRGTRRHDNREANRWWDPSHDPEVRTCDCPPPRPGLNKWIHNGGWHFNAKERVYRCGRCFV